MKASFAIVTEQRSGSNMLVDRLNRHPDIACFGEVFQPNEALRERDMVTFPGSPADLHKLNPVWLDEASRVAFPRPYLRAIFALRPDAAYCGFKVHLNQHLELALDAIADPLRPVILLRRGNQLARWSSQLTAKATGHGTTRQGEKIVHTQVEFDGEAFDKFVARSDKAWLAVETQLKEHGTRCLRVDYLQLSQGGAEVYDRIVRHIGPEPGHELPTEFVKRNPPGILERFTNPDAVVAHLEGIGRLEWRHESLSEPGGHGARA